MDLYYLLAVGSVTASAIVMWLFPPKWLATLFCGSATAFLSLLLWELASSSGHIPVFGERLEAPLSVAWILCIVAVIALHARGLAIESRLAVSGAAMCVASTLHVDLAAHPDAFWYTHWTVLGFFLFRVVSIAGATVLCKSLQNSEMYHDC